MMTVAKNKAKKPVSFADRLRQLRKVAQFSQKAVAESLEIGVQTYMRWERGETEPAFSELCDLAKLFGVTWSDLNPEE